MNFYEYENIFLELYKKVDSLKIDRENQETLKRDIHNLEKEFERMRNYINLNTEVYEKEKDILLNHFIQKDDEVNRIYRELEKYKNNKLFKLYRRLFKRK